MRATQALPAGYTLQGSMSLKENRRLLILLNLLGIPWFILCAIFFIAIAGLLGSVSGANGDSSTGEITLSLTDLLLALVIVVLTLVAVLVLHELTHGLFFWLFTHARPLFAFKGTYAYAASPGWYIPRPQFLAIGLAPLLLLSLLGLLVLAFTPVAFPLSLVLILALISNATGAIGDLYMIARLLFAPSGTLVEDRGDSIRWFGHQPAA